MRETFNIDEVFELAEQMERNGARFYRQAAENAADADSRGLLRELAQMEDDHEKYFANMRERISAGEFGAAAFDPNGEAAHYLQSMVHGRVFGIKGDPTRVLTGSEQLEQVLQIAIQLEKDTIVYYSGIKEMMPVELGRDRIDAIIREEMSHVILLNRRLEEISA